MSFLTNDGIGLGNMAIITSLILPSIKMTRSPYDYPLLITISFLCNLRIVSKSMNLSKGIIKLIFDFCNIHLH